MDGSRRTQKPLGATLCGSESHLRQRFLISPTRMRFLEAFTGLCKGPANEDRKKTYQPGGEEPRSPILDPACTGVLLVLHSSKRVDKTTTKLTMRARQTAPDPGLSATIELAGGDGGNSLNLGVIGEALACEGGPSKESPPTLDQIEPAGPRRQEHLLPDIPCTNEFFSLAP